MKTRRSKTLYWVVYDYNPYHIYAYSGYHATQILIRHLVDSGIPLESINHKEIYHSPLNTTFLK